MKMHRGARAKPARSTTGYSSQDHHDHTVYLKMLKVEFERKINEPTSCTKTSSDYDIICTIGSGGYANVFLVREISSLKYFALKVIDKREVVKKRHQKHMIMERKLLSAIDFSFVAYMECSFKDNSYLYTVQPFFCGGDMYYYLKAHGPFSSTVTRFYASQIVLAIEYLHFCGIIHRDIKPENILMDESGYVRLADFGFAKKMDMPVTWSLCGTPDYLAPELILSKGYDFSVDWWALGVLIFELSVGTTPFYASKPNQLYDNILSSNYKCPENMCGDCKSIIKGFLSVDTSKRLGCMAAKVYEIKVHKFFKETNWNLLLRRKEVAPFVPSINTRNAENFQETSDIKLRAASKNLYETEFEDF